MFLLMTQASVSHLHGADWVVDDGTSASVDVKGDVHAREGCQDV